MDLAAEIKARRERLGLDQEAFARLVGASVAAVSHWERGVNKPKHIARVLAVLDRAEAEAHGGGSDVRALADDELWRRTREHLAEIERRYYGGPETGQLSGGTGNVPPQLRRRGPSESDVDDDPGRTVRSNAPNG